jgi:hypothetical protein
MGALLLRIAIQTYGVPKIAHVGQAVRLPCASIPNSVLCDPLLSPLLMFGKVWGIIRAEIPRMVSASIFLLRKIAAARRLPLRNSFLVSGSIKSIHRHAHLRSQGS